MAFRGKLSMLNFEDAPLQAFVWWFEAGWMWMLLDMCWKKPSFLIMAEHITFSNQSIFLGDEVIPFVIPKFTWIHTGFSITNRNAHVFVVGSEGGVSLMVIPEHQLWKALIMYHPNWCTTVTIWANLILNLKESLQPSNSLTVIHWYSRYYIRYMCNKDIWNNGCKYNILQQMTDSDGYSGCFPKYHEGLIRHAASDWEVLKKSSKLKSSAPLWAMVCGDPAVYSNCW